MNCLDTQARAQVIRCLAEGNSIRSTVRITGVAKNTIVNLLLEVAEVCREFQDHTLRNLKCKRLQLDEIWSFVYAKEKNASEAQKANGAGDAWTWTAIDADSKLIVSWLVGNRDSVCATEFVKDVASRLKNRVQITTDGHKPYLIAMESAFGADVDYAMLQKIYGKPLGKEQETRYSLRRCGIHHRNQFLVIENVIGDSCFHRWRHSQCLMHAAEVVMEEVERNGGSVVRNLL